MFENRNRKRKRNLLLIITMLILSSVFGLAYYLDSGGNTQANTDITDVTKTAGYQIPDSIKSSTVPSKDQTSGDNPDASEADSTDVDSNIDNVITSDTKIIFRTYFTLCGHIVDKENDENNSLIGLTQVGLQNRYPDWKLNEFSRTQVILKRELQTYCPKHFIISVKDGYIAIYVYNSEGVKVMYELTDYPISVLTAEDQKNLEYGIIADNEEELEQKLDGLSD